MGQIKQIKCTRCEYQKEILIGGGLSDCKLKTILAALPGKQQRELAAEINRGAAFVSITRQPRVCSACGTIQALPVVTYMLDGTQKTLYGACSQCGKDADASWNDAQTGTCPTCGAAVEIRNAGHWD